MRHVLKRVLGLFVVVSLAITLTHVTSQQPVIPFCCALHIPLIEGPRHMPKAPWNLTQCPRPDFQLPPRTDAQADVVFTPDHCSSSQQSCRIQPLSPPHDLLQCLRLDPPRRQPRQAPFNDTTVDWSDDSLPLLLPIATWRSNKARTLPFTIVTQLTIERLPQLWAQCHSWRGPLSAAMHMVIPQQVDLTRQQALRCAVQQIGVFWARVEGLDEMCALDITLVGEAQHENVALQKYPINALRNVARLQSRTDMLLLLDIDYLLASLFSSPTAEQLYPVAELCRGNNVVVLPAFEVFMHNETLAAETAEMLVAGDKKTVLASIAAGETGLFASHHFLAGHAATDLARWINTNEFYEIEYASRFEPFLVIRRQNVPWHDARFRGYGQNKIVHVAHLNATGFKFVVHPAAYIVHRAHEKSPARLQFTADMMQHVQGVARHEVSMYTKVNALFKEAKDQMERGTFVPVLTNATKACRQQLSWWLG